LKPPTGLPPGIPCQSTPCWRRSAVDRAQGFRRTGVSTRPAVAAQSGRDARPSRLGSCAGRISWRAGRRPRRRPDHRARLATNLVITSSWRNRSRQSAQWLLFKLHLTIRNTRRSSQPNPTRSTQGRYWECSISPLSLTATSVRSSNSNTFRPTGRPAPCGWVWTAIRPGLFRTGAINRRPLRLGQLAATRDKPGANYDTPNVPFTQLNRR